MNCSINIKHETSFCFLIICLNCDIFYQQEDQDFLSYLSWLGTSGFTWCKGLSPFPMLVIEMTGVWSVPWPPLLGISAENPPCIFLQQCLPTAAVMFLMVQSPLFSLVVLHLHLVPMDMAPAKSSFGSIHKHTRAQADPH